MQMTSLLLSSFLSIFIVLPCNNYKGWRWSHTTTIASALNISPTKATRMSTPITEMTFLLHRHDKERTQHLSEHDQVNYAVLSRRFHSSLEMASTAVPSSGREDASENVKQRQKNGSKSINTSTCTPEQQEQKKLQKISKAAAESNKGAIVDFDWNTIANSVFASSNKDQRPIILFDGMCTLCNGGVNFALDHDSAGQFRFVSLQSKIGKSLLLRCGKQPDDISSIVLIEKQTTDVSATSSAESQQQQQQQSKVDGTVTTDILPIIAYYKSDAVLRIARKLDSGLWIFPSLIGVLGPLVPKFMRNVVYEFVAQNRYNFGHRLSILRDYYGDNTSCRLEDDRYDDRFIPDP